MKYLKQYENPDFIQQLNLYFDYVDALAFGYFDNEMRTEFDTHNAIIDSDSLNGRKYMEYPGRLWINNKVISFWKYPTIEYLPSILKDIEKSFYMNHNIKKYCETNKVIYELDFSDPEWLIEVVDKNLKTPNNLEWDEDTTLVPLSDYTGSKERNEEELKIPHLMNWKEKQELKKKGWGRGWGSDMTAPDGKNPLQWRQAKYVESFKTFEVCDEIETE